MADKKIDKALYGPSSFEVALGAVLGLLVGIVASCLYLALLKPVQQVKEMPKEPVAGAVYYIPGSDNSVKGRNWQQKHRTLAAGGEAILLEEELNAWASTLNAPPAPAKPAPKPGAKPADAKPDKAAAPAAAPEAFLKVSALNFRFVGDKLQVGLKCTLNFFGVFSQDVVVLGTGGFVRDDDRMVFKPGTLYLGSCPVHKLPAMTALLQARLLAVQKMPDESRGMWAKVTAVTIDAGQMRITTAQ